MILYTPLSSEEILHGIDDDSLYLTEETQINGRWIQYKLKENNQREIIRIISTNPNDYLQADLAPGQYF